MVEHFGALHLAGGRLRFGKPPVQRQTLQPTLMESHAAEQLPDAFRRSPTLRQALVTKEGIADLLRRLAGALDVDAVDRILDGR